MRENIAKQCLWNFGKCFFIFHTVTKNLNGFEIVRFFLENASYLKNCYKKSIRTEIVQIIADETFHFQ